MGDTGSLLSGFVVAILAIQFVEMRTVEAAPSISIGILFIPIFDLISISWRFFKINCDVLQLKNKCCRVSILLSF